MRPSIPILEDYDISSHHGFLPTELPLEILPDPYYHQWEAIIRNLQALILSRRLRGLVDALPTLSTDNLHSEAEWRRAYSVLAFITHAYVWGGDGPAEVCCFLPSSFEFEVDLVLDHTTANFDTVPVDLRPFRPTPCCNLCSRRALELQAAFRR